MQYILHLVSRPSQPIETSSAPIPTTMTTATYEKPDISLNRTFPLINKDKMPDMNPDPNQFTAQGAEVPKTR